jgi:hypothetical protein
MTDDRDRFLYNYMVFAKKKYKDNWKDKIVEAARNYFKFDSKLKQKLKVGIKKQKVINVMENYYHQCVLNQCV